MLALFVLVALIAGCSSEYPPETRIVNLNPNNIDAYVIQSDEIWMVKFYSPSMHPSTAILLPFLQASAFLLGLVKTGAVDIDKHISLRTKYNIQRIPTILIFGDNKYDPEEYSGPLTSQGIVDAVLDVKIITEIDKKFGTKSGSGPPANTNTNTITTTYSSSYSTLTIVFIVIGVIVLIIILIILLRYFCLRRGSVGGGGCDCDCDCDSD